MAVQPIQTTNLGLAGFLPYISTCKQTPNHLPASVTHTAHCSGGGTALGVTRPRRLFLSLTKGWPQQQQQQQDPLTTDMAALKWKGTHILLQWCKDECSCWKGNIYLFVCLFICHEQIDGGAALILVMWQTVQQVCLKWQKFYMHIYIYIDAHICVCVSLNVLYIFIYKWVGVCIRCLLMTNIDSAVVFLLRQAAVMDWLSWIQWCICCCWLTPRISQPPHFRVVARKWLRATGEE